MKKVNKLVMLIVASLLIIAIVALVLVANFNKPTEETIKDILVNNGISINGSDSNIIDPYTEREPNHVALLLRKEELHEVEVIDSGYDFLKGKYFCIFGIKASSSEHLLIAKALMMLHYDNGWKLSDDIGVLSAHYEISE